MHCCRVAWDRVYAGLVDCTRTLGRRAQFALGAQQAQPVGDYVLGTELLEDVPRHCRRQSRVRRAAEPVLKTWTSRHAAVSPEAYLKPALRELSSADGRIDVYVIPIEGAISKPNLFILRRGLKEAISNEVEMVVLDMDTPGGRVDICLEMMEMLDRFEGLTATYVNEDAISAGFLYRSGDG